MSTGQQLAQRLGDCLPGCANKRNPHDVCCREHWKRVPKGMRQDFLAAVRESRKGRGRRHNGRATKPMKNAFAAIVTWLHLMAQADPEFAKVPACQPSDT